jgi:uncharacterized membrane protein
MEIAEYSHRGHKKMRSVFNIIRDILRRQFLSGILVVVPLILTYVILRFLFEAIDGILSPYLVKLFGYSIPGLGIITTILLILLTGFFTRSIVGDSIYRRSDRFLARMPLIRIFYLAAKKLIEAIAIPRNRAFKQVVLFEYPRRGAYALGFSTTKIELAREEHDRNDLVGIFVPSTPTPVSGIVIFVPPEDIIPLDISVEEGLKLIVSGGIVAPPTLNRRKHFTIEKVELSNAPW